jgi:prevent-host-death family protein
VGVRDLKNRLSEYLRRVRSGEEILVTYHGEVVAELRRARAPRLETRLPD